MKKKLVKEYSELDKYYTKEEIAQLCVSDLQKLLLKLNIKDFLFLEPSAGSGSFLKFLNNNYIAYDIFPDSENYKITQCDFLKLNLSKNNFSKEVITIGNPPFGKKSKLAIEFLNKSLDISSVVGFIVPNQFKKWSVQSKINKNAKLIYEIDLPENSFSFLNEDYNLRCCFQVWSLLENNFPNLRISEKPQIEHDDFELYQYNRTKAAEKYFDYDWDFAVFRQGFLDYTFKAFHKDECDRKKQWIFFKAKNKEVLNNLLSIDFQSLSKNNLGTPGFGKHDVIKHYNKLFPPIQKQTNYQRIFDNILFFI